MLSYYDPVINASYAALIKHYGTAVVPARSRKPRDKPGVENAVLQACRWLLAPLRHRQFFSLNELNQAIALLLGERGTASDRLAAAVALDMAPAVAADRGVRKPLIPG